MQSPWESWVGLAISIAGFALSIAIVAGSGGLALWGVKRLIGESNFPALTTLIAIIGAVIAVYQASSSVREGRARQARTLVYATDITKKAMFLTSFGDTAADNQQALQVVAPAILKLKVARFEASAKALNEIDVRDLPSAISMAAVVRARAAASNIALHAQQGIATNTPVDFDLDIVEIGNVVPVLEGEVARLYPMYKVGPLLVGLNPQLM